MRTLLLVGALLMLSHGGLGAYVTNLTPHCGSLAGETRITIYGSGFSSDQFSMNNDPNKGNRVYFVTAKGTQHECRGHKDGSTTTQIMCYTPPRMQEEDHYVKVVVDATAISEEDHCNDNPKSADCTFKPQSDCTPIIDWFGPTSGNPGTFVTMRGPIYSDRRGSNNATGSNNRTERITRVYVGPSEAELQIPGTDTFYGLSLDNSTTDYGTIKAKTLGTSVGFFNASFIVEAPFGRSWTEEHHVSSNDDIYMYQQYTNMTSLSTNTGSVAGGLRLTGSVTFLDNRPPYKDLVITVGDEICEVIDSLVVINESFTCEVPADPNYSDTLFPGNRGIDFDIFPGTSITAGTAASVLSLPTSTEGHQHMTLDQTVFYDDTMEIYASRMTTFLSPPHNGDYQFYLCADDGAILYIDGVAEITSENNECVPSARKTLGKTSRYLLQVAHYASEINSSVLLKVKHFDTKLTSAWTSKAVQDQQNITVASTVFYDVMNMEFNQFGSQTATNEVQTVEVDVPETGEFRFCMFGACTVPLTSVMTENAFSNAIGALPFWEKEESTVVERQQKDTPTFKITFYSSRGDFPDFTVQQKTGSSPLTSYTVTETTKGVPDNDKVVLMYSGIISKPFSAATVDQSKLQVAVESLFEAKCPSVFSSPLNNDVKFYNNFEEYTAQSSGKRTKNTVPFSGRNVLQSPGYMYLKESTESGIIMSLYGTLCFAYKGAVRDSVRVTFTYKPSASADTETKSRNIPFKTDSDPSLRWSYVCVDLYSKLMDMFSGGIEYRLQRVGIFSQTDDTYGYVDAVFIGQKNTTNDPEFNLLCMPPALPNEFIIDDVLVTADSDTRYQVTLKPLECGNQLPLPILANGVITSGSSTFPSSSVSSKLIGRDGAISVTRTSKASPPTTGLVDITYNGNTKTNVNISDVMGNLEKELESIDGTGDMHVWKEGDCANFNYTATFLSSPGDLNEMTISNVRVDPTWATVSLGTVEDGGLLYGPIQGDMVSTVHTGPQVRAAVNGVPVACSTDCSFEWTTDATPSIASVTPTSGTQALNTQITIGGTGFNTDITKNAVTIGGVACSVSSATDSSIVCSVGNGPVGLHTIVVNVNDKGNSSGDVKFEYTANIDTVSPTSGSVGGGKTLTIDGSGFKTGAAVTINGGGCALAHVVPSQIKCMLPAMAAGTYDVEVRQGSSPVLTYEDFTYNISMTSTISSISPQKLPVTGGRLTIVGSSFSETRGDVTLGSVTGVVVSWTDTNVVVDFDAVPPGTHSMLLMALYGHATDQSLNVPQLYVDFKITNVTPLQGSNLGGTNITITGSTFGTDPALLTIKVGPANCENPIVDNTKIVCQIGYAGTTHHVFTNGTTFDMAFAFSPPQSVVTAGDTVRYSWAVPDYVGGIQHGVHEVEGPTNTSVKVGGFSSGNQSKSGVFTWQFTKPGKYYFWSGFIDFYKTTSFYGTVLVNPTSSWSGEVNLKNGGFDAIHEVGGSLDPSDTSDCKSTNALIAPCTDSVPTTANSDRFNFVFRPCSTPTITSINVRNATVKTDIIISGTGLSTKNCQNEVSFGNHTCNVISSSEQSVTCQVDKIGEPDLGVLYPLSVRVGNRGSASVEIVPAENRNLQLLPSIHSITPKYGSTEGGASVTITGFGFGDSPLVHFGTGLCEIIEMSYTKIICDSPPSAAGESNITLDAYVNNAPVTAMCWTDSKQCKFSYALLWTASLVTINPSTMSGSTTVTVTGSKFGNNKDELAVTIGGVDAEVISVQDTGTSLTATIDSLPPGQNDVVVKVKGYGKASGSLSMSSSLTVTSVHPSAGSVHGGAVITVEGNGFVTNETEVSLDDTDCEIIAISLSEVTCKTGAHAADVVDVTVVSNEKSTTYDSSYTFSDSSTPQIDSISPTSGLPGQILTISGSNLNNGAVTVTLNDTECTIETPGSIQITCTLGNHPTGTVPVYVLVAGYGISNTFNSFEYLLSLSDIYPTEGSLGGGQTVTLTGNGFEDAAVVTICAKTCIKIGTTSTQYTCRTPSNTAVTCTVLISLNDLESSLNNSYTYNAALSPSVFSVSPRRSGTGGGVLLTITGSGFGTDAGNVKVMIDSSDCPVSSTVDTEIVCVTGPHEGSIDTEVDVQVSGYGSSVRTTEDAVSFSYIDLWSSEYTWGGNPLPVDGDFIVVPTGMTLLLDVKTTPELSFLLIQGGKVVFDEMDIELHAKTIMITDGGVLQVGTEDKPFAHNAKITLHGHVLDPELPIYGTKAIAVREGTLELHGHPVTTWTRLESTVEAGSTALRLQQGVDWTVGDQIAIASTGDRHSQRENEKRTITGISADQKVLTVDKPLEYKHWGENETIGGKLIEYRAEVGLLTHNVVVKGSKDQQWNDEITACPDGFDTGEFVTQTCFQGRFGDEIGSSQFGAMILFHAPVMDTNKVIARLSYVEVTFAGQAFRLGRYPVHFHLNGKMTGSYVRGCSIHETFNRAVNIHGTHNVKIENNVIFNIMGGAFFLEDGIETGNNFEYNLAIFVKASSSLLNDDITPAAFWITNPNNTIKNNVAAGGTHFGFWYRMHEHPDGPSFDPNSWPKQIPLGTFFNNTAHSLGWFGLWVFPEYYPRVHPGQESAINWAIFEKFFAYNIEKGIEFVDTSGLTVKDCTIVNADKASLEAKQYRHLEGEKYTKNMVEGCLLVGNSQAISDEIQGGCTRGGLVLGYGPGFKALGNTFVNFEDAECAAIRLSRIDGTCSLYCGVDTYDFEQSLFINSTNRASFDWEFEGYLYDIDGTLTSSAGKAGYTIGVQTGSEPDDCEDAPEYSKGKKNATICPPEYKYIPFGFDNVQPAGLFGHNALISNKYGQSVCMFAEKRIIHGNGVVCALISGKTNTLSFEDAGSLITSNISFDAIFKNLRTPDYYTILKIAVDEIPDRLSVDGGRTYINRSIDTDLTSTSPTGAWLWDNENKMVEFVVSSINPSDDGSIEYSFEQKVNLRLFKCAFPNCEAPEDPNTIPPSTDRPDDFDLWDDSTRWAGFSDKGFVNNTGGSHGTPKDNENVKIVNGTWVIVNITTVFNELGTLLLEGVLEFIDTPGANYVIKADFIVIRCGRLIIGWPDDPFDGLASIVLRGHQQSPLFDAGEGPKLGTKAIGVFGGLDLFGTDNGITWTQLASKAVAGASVITVKDQVQWSVGDEIVIGPTSFRPTETEAFRITTVSADRFTLGLNATLRYLHTAHRETLSNGQKLKLGAAVGRLTRNIKIVGDHYADMYTESYGARVLVATIVSYEQICTGYARISNVEFINTGQEGFTEEYDPRFSLAYLNTGPVNDVKPSLVYKNSFHNGFSTGIGAIGTEGLNITMNVVYGAVGNSILIDSGTTLLDSNLVVLMIHSQTYQARYEGFNFEADAGIEAIHSEYLAMRSNMVTGCEGIAYHVRPLACDDDSDARDENYAFANFIGGVVNLPQDGLSDMTCAKVSGYTVWKSSNYGIYFQNDQNLIVSNVTLIENRAGIFTIVNKPDSVEHEHSSKFVHVDNSLIVGQTSSWDCDSDVSPTTDDNYKRLSNVLFYPFNFAGNAGMVSGNFYKANNGLPTHPWPGCMAYFALGGQTTVSNATFAHFNRNSCKHDYAITTNVNNDDGIHPTTLQGITTIDVSEESKLFFHRPNTGKINSADCVDMDCDGHKKCLVKDLDGSFLGHVGDVISQSEFEWDTNPVRGLGDYRIPKEMLTSPTGQRIVAGDICPHKGIIRNQNCTFRLSWQAYECSDDLDYEMLIIESMDEDTETRRLSPVAIRGQGYCDLINGPQDHGWCNGYTCRKRLSTFMALVAIGFDYEMHFTSVSPQALRFRLLNVDPDEGIKWSTWYSSPNRKDVYVAGSFVKAMNAYYDTNGRYLTTMPEGDEFEPRITDGTGSNYHNKASGYLTIIILGPAVIDIKTNPSIIVSLRLPSMTVAQFFGEAIVENIANFLGIPSSKVRFVNAVSAASAARRKRSTDEVIAEFQVSDEPTQNLNDTLSDSLSEDTLLMLGSYIVDECQVGNASTTFNASGGCESVQLPSSNYSIASVTYSTASPDHLFFDQEPVAMHEGVLLQEQPRIRAADLSNVVVTELGTTEYPWQLTASLRSGTGHPNARLNGTLTVTCVDGWFSFTDLSVSHMGSDYVLDFQVTYPAQAENYTLASTPFLVDGRPIQLHVADQTAGDIVLDTMFMVNLDLIDLYTGDVISDIEWRNHTWTAEAQLIDSSDYATLAGTLTSSFDTVSGQAMFPDLTLTGFGMYYIQFRVLSDPADYDLTLNHKLSVKRPDHVGMIIEDEDEIQVKMDEDYNTVLPDEDKQAGLVQTVITQFANMYPVAYFKSGSVNAGSIVVTFTVAGTTVSVNDTAYSLCDNIYNGTSFIYNGYTLTLSPYLTVNGQAYYGVTCGEIPDDDSDDDGLPVYAIVLAVILPIVVLALLVIIVWRCLIKPKTQTHVPVFVKPVPELKKFNHSNQSPQYIGSAQKFCDQEYLFRDDSFTSLGGISSSSPMPPLATTIGGPRFPQDQYYRGSPSPRSPPPLKINLTPGNWNLNGKAQLTGHHDHTMHSLNVPVSPLASQLEPRQSSTSGRASPMLHRAITPEREDSMPPVGEDAFKQK